MLSEDNPRRDLIWRRGEKGKGCWRSENVSYSDTLGESYPLLHSATSGEFLRTLSFRSPEGVTSSRKEEVTCLLSWETSLETIALNSVSNLQYRTLFSSRVKGHFSLMLFQRTRYPGLRSPSDCFSGCLRNCLYLLVIKSEVLYETPAVITHVRL